MAIDREKVLQAAQKYVEKKKYDKAVIELQKLVAADPNDARTLLKIGDLQSKMGTYPDAISTYEGVGRLYAQQGFALKAIAVYKQIRELIAKHAPTLEERYGHITPKLAELYEQLGLVSDALAALDAVATRLQRQQRDGEAIQVCQKIVQLDPTNPLPHLRLAEALSRTRDAEGAVESFKTAAKLLIQLGRRDDAIKVLERLLHHKMDADQARLCADLYLTRAQPQDGMLALAKLQVCFQADPRNLDTLGLLARAFNTIGQAAKAIEVQKEIARVARDTGKPELFREVVDRLLVLAPYDDVVQRLAAQAIPERAQPEVAQPPAMQPQPQYRAHQPMYPQQPGYTAQQPPMYPEEPKESSFDEAAVESAPAESSYASPIQEEDFESVDEQQYAYPEEGGAAGVMNEGADREVDGGETDPSGNDVQELLSHAAAFRRVHLYTKALEVLSHAIDCEPRNIEIHETFRDVCLEDGRIEEAVQAMLVVASLYVDALDGESAARTLQDVLAFDPDNIRAIELLRELGYELVDEEEPPQEEGRHDNLPDEHGGDTYAERLPSYDLEEMGPQDVSPSYGHSHPIGRGDPLPSFGMEHGSEYDAPHTAMPSTAPRPSMELEEALEESEFFASRGLFDDAYAILAEQLDRYPNHPLLRERLAELEYAQRTSSGTHERPREEDRSFDIAASLDIYPEAPLTAAAGLSSADQQVDVEEVFAKFKEGVRNDIADDDSQAHYNLAIAYKEMGLIDDAIRELEIAARDEEMECVCHSMVGMLESDRGNLAEAIDAFLRGLNSTIKEPRQETALLYELGAVYEARKMPREALAYYQKVNRRDPRFRDVAERIQRLSPPTKNSSARAAVGDQEFDSAFDENIFGVKR